MTAAGGERELVRGAGHAHVDELAVVDGVVRSIVAEVAAEHDVPEFQALGAVDGRQDDFRGVLADVVTVLAPIRVRRPEDRNGAGGEHRLDLAGPVEAAGVASSVQNGYLTGRHTAVEELATVVGDGGNFTLRRRKQQEMRERTGAGAEPR